MPNPVPYLHEFTAGDSFNDPENRERLKRNILSIAMKFGALTENDITYAGITFQGHVDLRGYQLSNISSAFGFVNLEEATDPLHTLVANANPGTVILVPPHYNHGISHSVDWKEDVHLVGCGPSSVIYARTDAGTASGFDFFNCVSIERASFRNLRLVGKRTFHTQGRGFVFTNCRSADIELENLLLGPADEAVIEVNGVTNSFPDVVVDIDGSSGIRMTGLIIRSCSGTGIQMQTTGTSLVENIDVMECLIEEAQVHGIRMLDCQDVNIIKTTVRKSGHTNIWAHECSTCILGESISSNSSTVSGGTDGNVQISGGIASRSVGMMVINSHLVENPNETKTSSEHLHMSANSGTHIIFGNFLNEVTGGGDLITDSSTESTRDGNHMHAPYYRALPHSHDDAFKAMDFASGDQRDFGATYGENFSHPGKLTMETVVFTATVIVSGGVTITSSFGDGVYAETGDSDDGVSLGTQQAIDKMANRGTLLTPSLVRSAVNDIENEMVAGHAMYNIVQPYSKIFQSVGSRFHFYDWWSWWFEPDDPATNRATSSGSNRRSMRNSVLSIYAADVSTLMIHGYSVGSTWSGGSTHAIVERRPTWVRLHV